MGGTAVGTPPGRRRYEERAVHRGDGKKRAGDAGLKPRATTGGYNGRIQRPDTAAGKIGGALDAGDFAGGVYVDAGGAGNFWKAGH